MTKFLTNKNKTITIIFAILIATNLVALLFSYSKIIELQEETSALNKENILSQSRIDDLEKANITLYAEIKKLENYASLLSGNVSILEDEIDKLQDTIIEQNQTIQKLKTQEYDYLLFTREINNTKTYVVKSGLIGEEKLTTSFKEAFEFVFIKGSVVKFKPGIYEFDSNIILEDKSYIILDGQGATLELNNYSISFRGDSYIDNQINQIKNLIFQNGTLRLENSFMITLDTLTFNDCKSAVEIINTNKWSEFTKFENCVWNNTKVGLTFKSPINNNYTTGSYENTAIERCNFNLFKNNSIAILVEKDAHVSNSQWTNLRIWMWTNENQTQTGLYLNGAQTNTLLNGVVFEGFLNGTNYGIEFGPEATTGITIDSGVEFIGRIIRIKNLEEPKWIDGPGTVFKNQTVLEFNNSLTKNVIISRTPQKIANFDTIIKTENLSPNETITIQIKLNFIDHTTSELSQPLIFNENTTIWLTQEDLFQLYPSQNIILNIEIQAQTNVTQSQTKVTFGIFGNLK